MARKRQVFRLLRAGRRRGEGRISSCLVERVVQQVLEAEMTSFLGLTAMSATGSSRLANGFKPRVLKTRVGSWSFWYPRIARVCSRPSCSIVPAQRKALVLSMLDVHRRGIDAEGERDNGSVVRVGGEPEPGVGIVRGLDGSWRRGVCVVTSVSVPGGGCAMSVYGEPGSGEQEFWCGGYQPGRLPEVLGRGWPIGVGDQLGPGLRELKQRGLRGYGTWSQTIIGAWCEPSSAFSSAVWHAARFTSCACAGPVWGKQNRWCGTAEEHHGGANAERDGSDPQQRRSWTSGAEGAQLLEEHGEEIWGYTLYPSRTASRCARQLWNVRTGTEAAHAGGAGVSQ